MSINGDWHKSSYSANGGNCAEARGHAEGVDLRDTQHREHGHLTVPVHEWSALLYTLRG